MIEIIKNKIWNLLKEKEVSLAMLFDKEGKIAWSRGRSIIGKTIAGGEGFSSTLARKALLSHKTLQDAEVVVSDQEISDDGSPRPDSLRMWCIKSVLIIPVADSFFLYVDSGTKNAFNQQDHERFKTLGELLGDAINMIRKNQAESHGISGNSPVIQHVRDRVADYSVMEEPVLIKGETGTGKNHVARLIHAYSGRSGNFKVINTPGIPENLFESEMFGHKKGAFTDAYGDKKGLIEEAENGTLFIDEVTEIPMSIQAKLLRFVETKRYTVLGESGERRANVRIVAATNKNLAEAIKNKEFRQDLYYRLNVLEINIPPLRERRDDLRDLVLEKNDLLKGKQIKNGFWRELQQHDWPGNIRELITVLTRVGVLPKNEIDDHDLQQILNTHPRSEKPPESGDAAKLETIWSQLEAGGNFWDVVKTPYLDRELNRAEVQAVIKRGLELTWGKYKGLMKLFNLDESEYKNFMRFLYANRLK